MVTQATLEAGDARLYRQGMDAHSNSKFIRGSTGDWEVVVGMEVHAQVASEA
jgi:hypothetical protein